MSNDEWFRVLDGGGVLLLVVLLVVGWWVARRHGPAVMAAAVWAPVGAVVAVVAVRPAYEALGLQPTSDPDTHTVLLIHRTAEGIWPSRHAALAGAVSVGLYFVRRRLGIIAAAIGVIMSGARALTGVHYPSDAVTGLILGALASAVGFVLLKGLLVLLVTRLRNSPLRPLVAKVAQPEAGY